MVNARTTTGIFCLRVCRSPCLPDGFLRRPWYQSDCIWLN